MLIIVPLWFSSCRVQRLTFLWLKHLSVCRSSVTALLLLSFCWVKLFHFSCTMCKSPPALAVGWVTHHAKHPDLFQLQDLWWQGKYMDNPLPPQVTRRDRCSSPINYKLSPNKVLRGWMCHPSPWSTEAVLWDNMELSCQAAAGCTQLSGFKEINNV